MGSRVTAKRDNYPEDYEILTITKGGLEVIVRPIRVEDAPRLVTLFHTLSPTTVYFRFLTHLKAPSEEMLAKFTQIDHGRHVVLVAVQRDVSGEKILGVFRVMCNLDGKEGELAIVVGDPWQGKGVGETLFQHGLSVAKQRGIESLVGMVAAENTTVLSLVRKLGFRVKWDSRDHVYHITMDLKSVDLKDLKDTAR